MSVSASLTPMRYSNMFVNGMIRDYRLVPSLLPLSMSPTNYAATGEAMWGDHLGITNRSSFQTETLAMLWTGTSSGMIPPRERYLSRLVEIPGLPVSDEDRKQIAAHQDRLGSANNLTIGSFYYGLKQHLSLLNLEHEDPVIYLVDAGVKGKIASGEYGQLMDAATILSCCAGQINEDQFDDKFVQVTWRAITLETSADVFLKAALDPEHGTARDYMRGLQAQYKAAQSYLVWLLTLENRGVGHDDQGADVALERGYYMAVHGLMSVLFASDPVVAEHTKLTGEFEEEQGVDLGLEKFIELYESYALFSKEYHLAKSDYLRAAGDIGRLIWLGGLMTTVDGPMRRRLQDNDVHYVEQLALLLKDIENALNQGGEQEQTLARRIVRANQMFVSTFSPR